jgi:hypothetical protein
MRTSYDSAIAGDCEARAQAASAMHDAATMDIRELGMPEKLRANGESRNGARQRPQSFVEN